MTPRRLLVSTALPYANGQIHLGHLVGYVQADIWVRAQRMLGHVAHFVCADDAHGTPIMLAAEKAGLSPEEFIQPVQAAHERDFAAFGVAFDHYHTTHSEENRALSELIYTRLRDAHARGASDSSHIARRTIQQLFDPVKEMFLPDRYIKGTCPNCGTPDQYGDNCENCSATYAPTDLKNPYSVVSGATPVLRDSEHYFFQLSKKEFGDLLRRWLDGAETGAPVAHPGVRAKLMEWLDADGGLRDWDISRDAPYFGFPIPDAPGKYFYVWLDAPIGYLASFQALCNGPKAAANGLTPASFNEFLGCDDAASLERAKARTQMHHFIGKDIVNFHGLFWPAMLHGAGFRVPTALHVNGYLTVNGVKMSKTRGTFIQARTYLDVGLNPEYLRYYYAAKSSGGVEDLDLNLEDFATRVNSDLVGKFVNIASRCAKLLETNFENRLSGAFWDITTSPPDHAVRARDRLVQASHALARVPAFYDAREFGKALTTIMQVADWANEYIAEAAPWALAKDPARRDELHVVLTAGLNLFRMLSIALAPVLPTTAQGAARFLALPAQRTGFDALDTHLHDHRLKSYAPLLTRVDPKQIAAMVEASTESLQPAPAAAATETKPEKKSAKPAVTAAPAEKTAEPGRLPDIAIDDFAKLDLRIGKVLACEFVEGSDKLLRFELDAGDLGRRQIFSGIRAAYAEPEKLVGRHVVFIANLAPRKMRFGVSEGMILSAGSGGADLFLLDVDGGAQAGMPVK